MELISEETFRRGGKDLLEGVVSVPLSHTLYNPRFFWVLSVSHALTPMGGR